MLFMVGPAASWTRGPLSLHRASPALSAALFLQLPWGTWFLGCLLESDIGLAPLGGSCATLHIENSRRTPPRPGLAPQPLPMPQCSPKTFQHFLSGPPPVGTVVQLSLHRASPVSGFRILCQCCCLDFCNNPKSKEATSY
ncbi:lymphocyte antigen 6 complex locus protein G5c [Psammomys obesus]|uniref:lymphocyte antigen 6 complex locus protein G5c n=1 Tax=Psammomys obesus TaxID=48139 RepID=UPI0024528225|nr:lymphocyte antigen 6 complex locus protein G5c [Psammomys obesus]